MPPQQHRDLWNFIHGESVPPSTDAWLDNISPGTGTLLGRIPRSGAPDVERAVAAAKAALQGPWGRFGTAERARMLDRIADGIAARRDELVAVESDDQGKPRSLAAAVDIPRAEANFRFFAGGIRHEERPCHPMDGHLNYTHRRPAGVCGLITPWNLPLYLLTWKVAPALAMGNTVVCKPSELTPRTASLLAEIALEAGLPPGVLNVVHGDGPGAGAPLTAHPDVQLISFTGGTATGRLVAAAAAPQFKKLSLELGGKNATVVFADADFEAAVAGAARAGFANQGEICLCGSRILVERSIYDRFLARLVELASALRVGPPDHPDTQVGALVSQSHRDKVEGYLRLAVEEGGTIACGGTRPTGLPAPYTDGFYLRPAVVTGLAPTCRTATEEIFGPVVTVHPFDTEEEAIAIANGVRYGLAGSVWTQNLSRGHRVAQAIESGMVWVNCWLVRDLRVPFGGMKESGVGREGGRWSLDFYSEPRNVCVRL
ncbi:MAG: 2-hydroxymuconic semialdehyde dehydrogenase [Deltaproteobacteria bacterium]|mgnify:CR=1 FL=1|nr:2-hydroxymuconic semialdehyde dehydrogenase [Deltaproteobacteria bacterium]HCH63444.1 2-hydroxymuconic semialdehyde dehydrogenase [Deltaproteobacteria bacterium]